jgi:predicted Rossmann fold nucleotide-binding protein DprA/Smf involved in DNA uptake
MDGFKVIIAGGRDFDNYPLLKVKCDKILEGRKMVEVISGMARGADMLGIQYADEYGFNVISKPANWDEYGKSAGYRRNREMAAMADACIVFWDGKSRGTMHMIELAKENNLPLRVIRY